MPGPSRRLLRRYVAYLAVLAGLWWLLTGGAAASWVIGLPVVLTAAGIAVRQGHEFRIRPAGALRFVAFFIASSVRAGVDVSIRVLARTPRVDPRLIECRLRLPEGPARPFLAGVLSLLPGTVTTELAADRIRVHVIDGMMPNEREIRRLEARVADLYALEMTDG